MDAEDIALGSMCCFESVQVNCFCNGPSLRLYWDISFLNVQQTESVIDDPFDNAHAYGMLGDPRRQDRSCKKMLPQNDRRIARCQSAGVSQTIVLEGSFAERIATYDWTK